MGIFGTLACAQVAFGHTFAEDRFGVQATGSITGTITTAAKGVAPIRVTIDQKICGNELPDEAVVVDSQGRLANAVVILTGLKRAPAAESIVTNEKCRFGPRVQLAKPNATVRTTSKDPILHTTQAQSENGRTIFNVALPMPGLNISKPIGAAGTVRLNCNTHPWMRGWMIVTDDAAAISGADGKFTLDNIPPGTYELRVWHESLKGAPQKITVIAGKPTEINFVLK
ncbi:MAG TPA: carboxypeptidase regulatory-like domain-containing protein [Vicinamibacterales bacterium]|nr:carboxypeptidase regulatory-like domain-containing protein [Vicinamibacterales bacterium]